MWDIVELRHDGMQELWTCEPVLSLYLRREVAEDDDGGFVGSDQERPDEELEMGQPLGVTGADGR